MSGDDRQLCVLMIGNGFSISLCHYLGIQDQIITNPLLPQPETTRYIPIGDQDPFPEQALWNSRLFPELWSHWEQRPKELSDQLAFCWLCEEYAKAGPLNDAKERGAFSFFIRDPRYQLRAYIWNLFRGYDIIQDASLRSNPPSAWPWIKVLSSLIRNYRLVVVSFNYDVNIERIIWYFGRKVIAPPQECVARLVDADPDVSVVLKPHGSIGHFSAAHFGIPNYKWLSDTMFVECQTVDIFAREVSCPPSAYPTFPDIVPPGHAGDHLGNPQTDVIQAINQVMAECDAFILCGLSADPPDTEEIAGYLRHLKTDRPLFHIDRDESKSASRLMKESSSRYFFVDPSELDSLPSKLFVALPLPRSYL